MNRNWKFGNLALIAVFLLGLVCANLAVAQVAPEATPTPDLHYLSQSPPGGVPIDAAPAAAAPAAAAPAEVAATATDAVSEEDILAVIAAPPCEVNGVTSCSRIYIPVMVRGSEGAPSEAQALSWRATVVAYATRVAQNPRTPTPTSVRPQPTATRPAATATRQAATATARPTSAPGTVVPAPTATATTMPMPMPTTTGAGCLNCINPAAIVVVPNPAPNVSGQMCPAWAHDLWIVTGPNGKLYRTWHPATQPAGMAGAGCNFDHSHGTQRDPRQSAADNMLPAYGYDADLDAMTEPHVGFKTEWANKGDCNTLEGFCSTSDVKLTVHVGTAGAGRLTQEMHTFIFDLVGNQGSVVHVRGMASTGDALTQCDPAPDVSGARGFRLIGMPKDQAAACSITSPYEVWQFHLTVGNNIITSKFATFDPITVGRRQANGVLSMESTELTWPNAPHTGCQHDVYFGGFFLKSNVDVPDMHGVRQYVKIGADQGNLVLDTVGKNTYKRPFDGCGPVNYTVN